MSRIDDALKRVAAAGKPIDGLAPVSAEPRFEGSLERYVAERHVPRVQPLPHAKVHADRPLGPAHQPPEQHRSGVFQVGLDGKLVISQQASQVSVEQYRRLAATLHDLRLERHVNSLMVCSAVPKEGKTLTVTNLALTLTESYHQRVLLIDADLRRPSIHEMFGLPLGAGLTNVLRSGAGEMPVVEVSGRLSVLTAGRNDAMSPLAQLTSRRFAEMIARARSDFDWILVDTPPIGLLPDAHHVARVCDGVLFVIGAGSTPYVVVQKAIAELGPDRIVGTLLNRVTPGELRMHQYGDYYSSNESAEA